MILLLGIIYVLVIFLSYYCIQKWCPRNLVTYDSWEEEDNSIGWCLGWPVLMFVILTYLIMCILSHIGLSIFNFIKEVANK